MRDIDEMDMLGFLRVRAHRAKKEKSAQTVKKEAFIDEVWNF